MIISALAANSHAWEGRRIKCKNPEAGKLADRTYNILTADLSDTNLDSAISMMEKAAGLEADNDMFLVELSGDLWRRGERFSTGGADGQRKRLDYFNRGAEAAKKALSLKNSAAAHFWYAVNLGAGGEKKSSMEAMALLPTLAKHVETSRRLDPLYGHGAATRFWTAMVPRLPENMLNSFVKPGDATKDLDAVIAADPLYFENRVIVAETFHYMKRPDRALAHLEFILSNDPNAYPDPAWRSLNRREREKAGRLWKQWTGKDFPNK